MNTNELINYYANLLIIQYIGQGRAYAHMQTLVTPLIMPQTTVETIIFTPPPSSGAFTLFYGTTETASINWNDSTPTIQSAIRAVSGLGSVLVTGSIATGLSISFVGVTAPASVLTVGANTTGSQIDIEETDLTMPLAVQDAFNLFGDSVAVGVQLDTLGKYVGVKRTNQGFTTQITLNDSDFATLIQIATVENNAGSSTEEITRILQNFFPNLIFLFDRQTMEFDYYLSAAIATPELLQVFIANGRLPKPMAVRIRTIIYAPIINLFFGLGTYEFPRFNTVPFNSYSSFNTSWLWLSYQDAIIL